VHVIKAQKQPHKGDIKGVCVCGGGGLTQMSVEANFILGLLRDDLLTVSQHPQGELGKVESG